jgi:glutaredoxin-like protein
MAGEHEAIIVYGTTWCPDCKRSKQFFGDQRIHYHWVDIERDSEAMAYVEEVNQGKHIIPTIVFPDGSILVEPSNAELAEKLGLKTEAERTFYDVVVVGAGPAGLTAAIYAGRDGLDALVIEKAAPGGQAGITQVIDNYPGFDQGITGEEFGRRLVNQARRFGAEVLQAQEVTTIRTKGRYREVLTNDGSCYAGRAEVAARILRTFAHFVDQGMLPNRFPDEGETPEYNTVDATLWYFEAIRAYHAATGDDALLRDLFPVLQEMVEWHRRGTRYNIHVDPADGLLYAGEPGVQLTWMDAKVGGGSTEPSSRAQAEGLAEVWVVTPRIGKVVEVNALWYNTLCSMADFARRLNEPADRYETLVEQTRTGFARFWSEAAGYCYDVIDGPDGDDPALRPNQLLAVSLPHSPLDARQQRSVVDVCTSHLLTSHGLRSLAPEDPAYVGHYGGDQRQRDAAYHQGSVWGWLIGPFVSAYLRVYGDRERARSFLRPLIHHLADHGVGSISEIFNGDPPFTPRGCIAQAWSVAEVLRTYQETMG